MERKLLVVLTAAVVALSIQLLSVRREADPLQEVPLAYRLEEVEKPSYELDIQPLFNRYCLECHGADRAENGLRLDNYESSLRGTRYGPVIIPGRSAFSTLVYVLDGTASEKIAMPYGKQRLDQSRIENIKHWIDTGARRD